MLKSTVIATCLLNSKMAGSTDHGERLVRGVFVEEFPNVNFDQWNSHVNDEWAANTIRKVGVASKINVR